MFCLQSCWLPRNRVRGIRDYVRQKYIQNVQNAFVSVSVRDANNTLL